MTLPSSGNRRQCRYAEWHCAECRGAQKAQFTSILLTNSHALWFDSQLFMPNWGAQQLMYDNLKVVQAKFSTLSKAVLLFVQLQGIHRNTLI
jgi:hypothetical protein